jgi:hypothetical protein
MKIARASLLVVAQIVGPSPDASARDYGEYEDVPRRIRDWFKALKNPRNGGNRCDLSDCRRTDARTNGNQWQTRAPDGSWITISADKVVHNQGNPTGEPILCAYEGEEGWRVVLLRSWPWHLGKGGGSGRAPCPEMLPRTAAVWPKPSGLLSKYILWLYSKFYTQFRFGWANHVRIDGSWYRVRSPRIGLYSERRIATVDPVLKSRERAVMTSPPGPR